MNKIQILSATLVTALGLSGCYNDRPYDDDRNFGASVRNMVVGQINDRDAAINPPAEAPQGLDGPAAVQVMKTYRTPPPKPTKASVPVRLSITD